ncbi:MAG TPA: LacI family DNA-binding transcriptional regulator [Mucilaginibacter sp.]|nr:LacI family DNA-binding transcriptional regulator [Mucilaginibacter sp.]
MRQKPATIKEIAKLLGVSVSTVSRGLHDHPSIGLTTRQKIRQLADQLQYEPNQTAIFLKKGSTQTIGVILPELSEAFFSAAISAIEETAFKRNYTVLLAQSHDDEQLEKQLVEKMKNHRVDGLLVSVGKNTSSYRHFENLRRYDIPVVFFDRIPGMQNIHYVACNMETGTVEAVSYLLKKGHRAIGMINGPGTLIASGERKDGYIKAMTKNRLKFDPSLVISSDLTETGTRLAVDELLANKRKPTAIVTFNDYIALFAIKYARQLSLTINKDIEFVSYANLPIINYLEYAPTASVEQFPRMQGQKAADILLDLLNQKKQGINEQTAYYKIIIESQLIERI